MWCRVLPTQDRQDKDTLHSGFCFRCPFSFPFSLGLGFGITRRCCRVASLLRQTPLYNTLYGQHIRKGTRCVFRPIALFESNTVYNTWICGMTSPLWCGIHKTNTRHQSSTLHQSRSVGSASCRIRCTILRDVEMCTHHKKQQGYVVLCTLCCDTHGNDSGWIMRCSTHGCATVNVFIVLHVTIQNTGITWIVRTKFKCISTRVVTSSTGCALLLVLPQYAFRN